MTSLRQRPRRLIGLFFVCVWCCLVGTPGVCQDSSKWRYWRVADGLAESYSRSLYFHPSGRLWVNHGIVNQSSYLDGYQIHKINSPGPYVPVIENSFGQIWSVYNGGFQLYRNNQWRKFAVEGVRETTPFISRAQDEVIYLFAEAVMVFHGSEGRTEPFIRVDETRLERFISLASSHDGGVWITGNTGLIKIEPFSRSATSEANWKEYPLPAYEVRNLRYPLEGKQGNLYVVGQQGDTDPVYQLLRFDGQNWHTEFQSETRIRRGWRGPDGVLWVLLNNSLFSVAEEGIRPVQEEEIISSQVYDVACEADGSFWLAMSSGLARYSLTSFQTPEFLENPHENVHAITEHPAGVMWFAGKSGLIRMSGNRWEVYPYPSGISAHQYECDAFCVLRDGRLMLNCTRSPNLLAFHPQDRHYELISHPEGRSLRLVAPHEGGAAWIRTKGDDGNDYRLELYDGARFETVIDFSQESETIQVRHVMQRANGEIWIGYLSGVCVFKDGKLRFFDTNEGFWGTGSFWIHELNDGAIWAGCRNAIHEFDGTRWTTLIAGLDRVNSIETTKNGDVWVSSDTGLHRYRDGSWISYTRNDGLPASSVNRMYQDQQGRIWIGTTHGISFYRAEIDVDPPLPIISQEENAPEFPYGGNVYLRFSGVDKWNQTLPEDLQFSYRLNQGEWSKFTAERIALYHPLRSGDYRFEVRSRDKHGNISPTNASFEFRVLQPWHQSNEFIFGSILIVTLIGSLFVFFVYHNYQLEKIVKERTATLTQINLSFEREIKDRQAIEETLRKSEKMYREAIEVAGAVPYYRNYLTDRYDFIGESVQQLTGYTKDELTPTLWRSITLEAILLGDLAGCSLEEGVRIARTVEGIHWRADYRILTKNQVERWIANAAVEVRDEQGAIIGSLGIFQDITDRMQTEQSLRISESKNRALLNAMPDAMFRINKNGMILDYQHPAEFEPFGFSSDAIGKQIQDVLPNRLARRFRYHLSLTAKTNETELFEFDMGDEKQKIYCEFRIVSSGGEEAIAIVRDITERKQLEDRILRIRESEQERIGNELHDDLCQILTGIALKSKVLEEQLESLRFHGVEHAREITKGINRAIGKTRIIAKGLHPINLSTESLQSIFVEMGSNAERMFDVQCHLEFDQRVSIHDTEKAIHLYRIAQEALNNAIRHGGAREVWIRVLKLDDHILMTIRDNGTGFDDAIQKTNDGMGLNIMKYRARIINASLSIATPERGTIVTCALPLPHSASRLERIYP